MPKTENLGFADGIVVALGEYDTGWQDPELSLSRASETVRKAREAGADLVVLPEMCTTGFTMDVNNFAELPNGRSVQALAALAVEYETHIVAGLSMKRDDRYLNSALVFAADGSVIATYDKQRLFGYGGEKGVYSSGDAPCVVKLGNFSFAVFVCFDLRFPELFREVGPSVDACIVLANWPTTRQRHWEILTTARAIENQCYVAAVNRIGHGGGLDYTGGSVIVGPWGDRCDSQANSSSIRVGEISPRLVAQVRAEFPLPR